MARRKKPALDVIEEKVSRGQQSITAQRLLRVEGYKVRLTVKSDSYNFQSFARAEIWNPNELKWNTVHSIPYALMRTPAGLCHHPNGSGENIRHFEADLTELYDKTYGILF